MSPRFVLGWENVPCVAEVVNRSFKADCTDFNNMFSFIYKYFKYSLFCIYSLVGLDNMCISIQQYFKCLLFCIYSRVGVNNMCTFIAIFLMFVFI